MWCAACEKFNLWPILVSGVGSMVIGSLWYGPLFGKAWGRYTGWTEEKIKTVPARRMLMSYALALVAAIVSAVVMSVLAGALGLSNVRDGIVLGMLCGVGFVAMAFATTFLFERKAVGHWLIVSGYEVVYLTLAAVLVTIWR